MSKTKKKILDISRKMFNRYGVEPVSIRQISAEVGISHSNLIYHFKNKNEIVNALHNQLFAIATEINAQLLVETNLIDHLLISTKNGFKILLQYKFLLVDLNAILRGNPELHQSILQVESFRQTMYMNTFQKSIELGLMRDEEYKGEFDELVTRIRVFSDYWISSAEIYDSEAKEDEIIDKYALLLINTLYPYLTDKGKEIYSRLP